MDRTRIKIWNLNINSEAYSLSLLPLKLWGFESLILSKKKKNPEEKGKQDKMRSSLYQVGVSKSFNFCSTERCLFLFSFVLVHSPRPIVFIRCCLPSSLLKTKGNEALKSIIRWSVSFPKYGARNPNDQSSRTLLNVLLVSLYS